MSWKYRNDELDLTLGGGIDLSTVKGGIRPPASLWNTGNQGAQLAADGNNSTPVSTELYVAALFVAATCLVTGIAVFNGSDVTDNIKAGLYDQFGTLLRASASTAGSGADAYQRLPFATDGAGAAATTIVIPGPGLYFVGTCYASNTSRYNTFAVGNFPAGKITSLVFATNFAAAGTALTITPPTTFTTALGPIAGLY